MGKEDFRRTRRKRRREVVNGLLDVAEGLEEREGGRAADPGADAVRATAAGRGHALAFLGVGILLAGLAFGVVRAVHAIPPQSPLESTLADLGMSPLLLTLLGAVCLGVGGVLARFRSIEGQTGWEIEGLAGVSSRMESLLQGIEGFRDRLEAIRSDRVAATLNQVRYEVSALCEKVHRELMPSTELRNGLVGITERTDEIHRLVSEAKGGGDQGEALDALRVSIQETLRGLDPAMRTLREEVASGLQAAGRGLERIAGIAERLEGEIRSLDDKAVRILSLNTELLQVPGGNRTAAASPRDGAREAVPAPAAGPPAREEDPPTEGRKDDSTFRAALERLRNLRG